MRLYHEAYGSFPPPYTVDQDGKRLHSWRVLILPYLDEKALYGKIRLDEPWDSPHNRRFAARMPPVYRCGPEPDRTQSNTPSYLMITGPGTVGDGPEGTALHDIPDGPAKTLLVAETDRAAINGAEINWAAINWMQPVDFDIETMAHEINPSHPSPLGPSIKTYNHNGDANGLFCDGSVRTLYGDMDTEAVEAMLTKDGEKAVESPDP